ncbi:methyltransferase domain protein [Leptospira broomii serovar Hurstbridge str. 5399]|uniref:Methyltransferase domain protein n=1 Tax=Leptospira broomii serovar Hurstbridge str. 5399 TaxID=1049789 RepID=T0GKH4_9LEPT|nr:methyltransferase domain-containing protein [Leptospira broomii]EQA45888.1 methyltransferase domain protein [Leptospira broomii serovar Hurstbridge str. 5399]
MPDAEYWDSLFDVPLILDRMKLLRDVGTIVEFGSGYGTFTLPLAENPKNKIIAFEIEKELVRNLKEKSALQGLENIFIAEKDIIGEGTSLLSESVDYVMIFNLLHYEDPVSLLKEANRILKPGGIAGLVHWNYDPNTPRGPKMEIRPKPLQIYEWANEANFQIESNQPINLPPYHYGLIAYK